MPMIMDDEYEYFRIVTGPWTSSKACTYDTVVFVVKIGTRSFFARKHFSAIPALSGVFPLGTFALHCEQPGTLGKHYWNALETAYCRTYTPFIFRHDTQCL